MDNSNWGTRIVPIEKDLSTVCGMYYYGDEVTPNIKTFVEIIKKNPAQLMLAVTAPKSQQTAAWLGLKAAGFKPIANGVRTPGHFGGKYLVLWGKKFDCKQNKGSCYFTFSSCGATGIKHPKTTKTITVSVKGDYYGDYRILTVHRVPIGCKAKIPKQLKWFTSTKLANYYLENAARIFKKCDL